MTQSVQGLEAAGLVVRVPDPQDGRGCTVRLSPKGRALVRRARARKIAWIDEVLVDGLVDAVSVTMQLFHGFFVTLQNGRLSRYAVMMLFGAVGVAAILIFVVPRGM